MITVKTMRLSSKALLFGGYFLALLVLAFPVIHERLDARNLGFPLNYGSDFSHYLVRLEQGLIDPGSDTSNGIFSVPDSPPGFQPGGMERMVGFLLSGTGWPAVSVMMLLSVVFGALIVPLLQLLLQRTGLSGRNALFGALLYFFLFLGPMQRFVHASWSLPFAMFSVLLLWRFWERPALVRALCAGVILGLLPHVYLWGWTFVWCTAGLLGLFAFFQWKEQRWQRLGLFVLLWLCALLVSAPYFFHIIQLSAEPLAREVSERSSVIYSRGIESVPRSILTFLLASCAFLQFGWKKTKASAMLVPVVCLCISSFVVLHQQFVHERVISFATHYYPYICVAALLFAGALIARWKWSVLPVFSFLLCVVFLGAAFLDYSLRFDRVFRIDPERYMYQHFVTLLPVLRTDLQREVILTDPQSALMVASTTRHDVVFTEHARHLLIPTTEYAERYCTATLFDPAATGAWIAEILREPSNVGREREEELFYERLQIATAACERVRQHPDLFLQKYGVTEVLWDEKNHPDWTVDRTLFRLETQGEGWSLWRMKN